MITLLESSSPILCYSAGKYVTGDVHPEYLEGLESSVRAAARDRAGRSLDAAGGLVAAAAGKI